MRILLAPLVALSLAVGLGAQASQASPDKCEDNGVSVVCSAPPENHPPAKPSTPKTVDTPLSDTDALKVQLAATTFERDVLRIDAEAQAAKVKAQKTYQDALSSIAGKGCTLGATAEGNPVRRCPTEFKPNARP